MEEASCTSTSTDIAVTSRGPALIWEHFTKINDGKSLSHGSEKNPYNAKCNICQTMIKTAYGNTTGMRRHLENKHYSKYLILKKRQDSVNAEKPKSLVTKLGQPKLQAILKPTFKWSRDNTKSKTITREIGKWMASSLHPYNLVEQEGFKSLLNILEPHYEIPSGKIFSRKIIPGLYNDVTKQVEQRLETCKKNCSTLAITVDMWSSDSNNSFMSLTSHFMTTDFEIENLCLGCYSFFGDHKGLSISQKVTSCLADWKLDEVLVPIYSITDNATNMKSAMSSVKPTLKVLSCFAHSLQLAIADAKNNTSGIGDLMKKVKGIVGHYRHSCQATARLHKIQEEMNRPKLQLIQNCDTRWNSEYLMLERFLKNKEPISRDVMQMGKMDNLTISEWKMVEGYVNILEPLFEATSQVCSAIKPTCSMVIPIIFGLTDSLETFIEESPAKTGIQFAREMLKSIRSRFPNMAKEDPYLTAMMVDPRFKSVVLTSNEQDLALSKLKIKLKATVEKDNMSSNQLKEQVPTIKNGGTKSALWKAFAKAAAAKEVLSSSPSKMASIEAELARFFDGNVINHDQDPCQWWRDNAKYYPTLHLIALQYLGIPATEVASERMFSSAGGVVSEKRTRLSPFHVEELVFLHQNKKFLK